jgi:hypothetical protein
MSDEAIRGNYNFDISDDVIHELAPAILLSKQSSEFTLNQGKYAYRVKGGKDGYLYYKKRANDSWILIANWCLYGLYIVIRYRKPLWLRSMYQSLFSKMNFVSIAFSDHSIEAMGTDGQILKGRRLRLSPPFAFEEVMMEKFGYSLQKAEVLRSKLNL